jgi:hypothetical protein
MNVVTPSRPQRSGAPGHNPAPTGSKAKPITTRAARFQPERFDLMTLALAEALTDSGYQRE